MQYCGWEIVRCFLCWEMSHPPEENLSMCKYVHTRVYCAKAVRDAMGHLALKCFPAGLCLFLPLVSHFMQWFLLECAAWGPTTVPTGTCRPLISHYNVCFIVLPTLGKGCSGLELGRGSAYNSGRAQGNLYATRPAPPPFLAQAKNSQWSCSGRNPTLSWCALSQEEWEQSGRWRQEAKPKSPKSQSPRVWIGSDAPLT